jgi:hypothetical protein
MFSPAQLICRPKLGLELSSYYMWREGGLIFLMPRLATTTVYKKWRWEFGFNCARWNIRKPCLVHLDTIYDIYATHPQQVFIPSAVVPEQDRPHVD